MSFEPDTKRLFHYVKFVCGGISTVMILCELNFGDPNDASRIDPDLEEVPSISNDIKSATQP